MTTLVFDLDDTLYDQTVPFMKAVSQHLKLNRDEIYQLYLASRKYSDQVFAKSESKEISMEDMYIYRLKHALLEQEVNLSDQKILEIQDLYSYYQAHIELIDGMATILDYCKEQQFTLGIITNGPYQHQLKKIESLALYRWIPRENMIISGQIGRAKPDPQIFKIFEEQLAVTQKNYYIGDSFENDVVGSKKAGWQSIWFNHRQREKTDLSFQPDFTVKNSEELLEILKFLD